MPPEAGSLSGTPYKDKKLAVLIEYIKSLGNPQDYHPMSIPASVQPRGHHAKRGRRRLPRPVGRPLAAGSAKPQAKGNAKPQAAGKARK